MLSLNILSKTVALQAQYPAYVLLEAGIMYVLCQNLTKAKSFDKLSSGHFAKCIWFVSRHSRAHSFLINLLALQSFFIS